ncbi:MAG: hypothetical protein ACE5IR_11385 [bacterium]
MASSKKTNSVIVATIHLATLALSLMLYQTQSYAIPAFARRYRTSCSSCHVVIPKLNHFGRAFKANGYRIPPKDEAFIKQQPDVKLGDDEWKEVWPKGIWPGSIPGIPPIALRIDGDFVLNPQAEINSDFDIPREIEILSGGHAGDGFSYFLELAFEHDNFVLERAFGQFDRIGGSTLFNIKVGRYELAAAPFSRFNRRLTSSDFITSQFKARPGGVSFAQRQQGLELWGARSGPVHGGFEYGIGIVNGTGSNKDNNSAKDIYYRFSYKFGGFGVAGSKTKKAAKKLKQTNNWRDDSIKVGTFGYFGTAGPSTLENKFDRIGFDFDLWYRDLNLFGIFMHGRELKNSFEEFSFNTYFIEADYVFLPWVIGILRVERVIRPGPDIQRIVPGVVFAYRANIRLVNEAEIYRNNSGDSLIRLRLDFLF